MVLHDFQAADDQELTVFKDQEVHGGSTLAKHDLCTERIVM